MKSARTSEVGWRRTLDSTPDKSALPRVAIVGRQNVGKSTLFNRLLQERRAITDKSPGVTRDPVEATCLIDGCTLLLTDTGGFTSSQDHLEQLVVQRSLEVAERSNLILLLVDVKELTGQDQLFVEHLRPYSDRLVLVVNKVDNAASEGLVWNFHKLGLARVLGVSAAHGRNIAQLRKLIVEACGSMCPQPSEQDTDEEAREIRIAILGKPNTGKSTLANTLLNDSRSLVDETPGTTRDVIEGHFGYRGLSFRVLDTAGIRRKKKVITPVEYYSVNRAIKSIMHADVVLLLIEVAQEVSQQDKKIAKLVVDKGKGILLVLSKWDLVKQTPNRLTAMTDRLRFLFPVLEFAPVVAVSATSGYGISRLCETVIEIRKQLERRIETGKLNRCVSEWVRQYPLPVRGKNVRIRYATQVEANPVKFVFFVHQSRGLPRAYLHYLKNKMRTELGFGLIPIEIGIRES